MRLRGAAGWSDASMVSVMSRKGVGTVIVGAALVMTALVVSATQRGSDLLSRPETTLPTAPPTVDLRTLTSATPTASATSGQLRFEPSPILSVLLQVFFTLLVLWVVLVIALLVGSFLRRFRPSVASRSEAGFRAPEVPREVLEGVDEQLSALGTGAPRNAIVAAWVGLELAASASGLPRQPAETTSEYVTRVLGVWKVDAVSLDELASLYREARFSTHPLSEEHRARAIAALRRVQADLGHAVEPRAVGGPP